MTGIQLVGGAPAPATSKSQTAYVWIRDRIIRGEFTPGYRLVLAQLAGGLDMSVVPVREAVRRLEAEGLVTFERNVGAQVAMIDERGYVDAMQTLGIVEAAATALAVPLLTPQTLERARGVNAMMRAMLDDFEPHTFTRLNQQFHTHLFEHCPNQSLLELVHRGWARVSGFRDSTFAFVPERARGSVDEHDHLLTLIASGARPAEIEVAARAHRDKTTQSLVDRRAAAAFHPDTLPGEMP